MDVRLPDIDYVVRVGIPNRLSIEVHEEGRNSGRQICLRCQKIGGHCVKEIFDKFK